MQHTEFEVLPYHTAVKGRVRFKIKGLSKSKSFLKPWLEDRLQSYREIQRVKINPLTGSALIHYNPEVPLDKLQDLVEQNLLLSQTKNNLQEKTNGVHSLLPSSSQGSRPTWHALSIREVLQIHQVDKKLGLPQNTVSSLLQKYGPNILQSKKQRSHMEMFLFQLKPLPQMLLSGSAAISLITGGVSEAVVIVAVVAVNAYIGYKTEALTEVTINALGKMGPQVATVIRDGILQKVKSEDIVPGDLLLLVRGMIVPADGRILQAENCTIDESALTGESSPVAKFATQLEDVNTPLAERFNMVYRGTIITGGSALVLVTETGSVTQIGLIQNLVNTTEASGGMLQQQLDKLSTQLLGFSGLIGGGVLVAGIIRGHGFWEMVKTSVSLAIAAVPEGLPTVVTTTLAYNALQLKEENLLVRNLSTIETLGALQIVCFDKTGTLTMNRMSVEVICLAEQKISCNVARYKEDNLLASNLELKRLLETSCLCNETEIKEGPHQEIQLLGSSTEVALVDVALLSGIDLKKLRREWPLKKMEHRTESRSYMVTVHQNRDMDEYIAVKGRPEEVLDLCGAILVGGQVKTLTQKQRSKILFQNKTLGENSLRVLGVAYSERSFADEVQPQKYIWVGLVGLADTPREFAGELVQILHRAGIKTALITGDQKSTAMALAQQLDLADGNPPRHFPNHEIEYLKNSAAKDLVDYQVFSRVSPREKMQIVKSLRNTGKVVAMIGDGVNDAPVLKAADIGIAMGKKGNEVACSIADAVMSTDDLHALLEGVKVGRCTREAIRNAVIYLLSTNLSETVTMFGAISLGWGAPINPLQILWINLISDILPALALGLEPTRDEVLTQPAVPFYEPLIGGKDFRRAFQESSSMTLITLLVFQYGRMQHKNLAQAQSMAFMTLATAQLLHTFSSRSDQPTFFTKQKLPKNKYVPAAVAMGFLFQASAFFIPAIRNVLGNSKLQMKDLLLCSGGAVINSLLTECFRLRSADKSRVNVSGLLSKVNKEENLRV